MRFSRKLKQSRYRIIDGKPSIELSLKTPRQLFDERDPAPFRDRDLDSDAARYILTSFKDLKGHRDVKLSLYFESLGELEGKPQVIANAIREYFAFEARVKHRELIDLFRQGLIALVIGLTFLFSFTYFAQNLDSSAPKTVLNSMVHEGLFIAWWVAMWRPISIFLYDWLPIRESLTIYKRLSQIDVTIQPLISMTHPKEASVLTELLSLRQENSPASPAASTAIKGV